MQPNLLTEAQRRKAVAVAIALASNTSLAPQRYERQLLAQYESGKLSLDEMENLLAAGVYHVFYRSKTVHFPTATLLQELLDWSRDYNARHDLTGVLLYSEGQFVQLIEGPEAEVSDLYSRIQCDSRHTQVSTLSEGLGPKRHFADWRMAFNVVSPAELDAALGAVAQQRAPSLLVENAHLQELLVVVGISISQ